MVKNIYYCDCSNSLLRWLSIGQEQGAEIYPQEVLGIGATTDVVSAILNGEADTLLTNDIHILEQINDTKVNVYKYDKCHRTWNAIQKETKK